jgi:flagellar basal-body rod modification protein FlgD
MSTVYPISSASPAPTSSAPAAPDNQLGEDTFLKLLVAQLKYQDPMNPTDSTQFLTQTAQFTELETLQKIQKSQDALNTASQTLTASSMVGRNVTYALNNGNPVAPTGTSIVSLRGALPKDADAGTKATATSAIFTKDGARIPLTLTFTKSTTGWSVQASSNGQSLGSPQTVAFNSSGDHTGGNLTIPASALNAISGTTDSWPSSGLTLDFGDSNDPTRLQLGSGPATVTVAEQNGNDGATASGIVTGVHLTTDGPQLVIGGLNIPLTSVTDVQV